MKPANKIIRLAIIACFTACIGDVIMVWMLGLMDPGYKQIRNSLSELGTPGSPVSIAISTWWTLLGLLFVLFGIGFRKAYSDYGKTARWAAALIIIYGIGEGVGSGLFRISHIGNRLSTIGLIHDTLGGIGITAATILPFVLRKIFSKKHFKFLFHYSLFVVLLAIALIILFDIAKLSTDQSSFIVAYKGLWQRMLSLDFYLYFIFIAIKMTRAVHEAK